MTKKMEELIEALEMFGEFHREIAEVAIEIARELRVSPTRDKVLGFRKLNRLDFAAWYEEDCIVQPEDVDELVDKALNR